jgi:putative DNA primase/helicase
VLIVIDPIVSVVTGNSHANAEVRRALQPLVDIAAETGCAVLGITHVAKGSHGRSAVERVIGSQAFGALARLVLMTGVVQPDGARRVVRAKTNIGPDGDGFEYSLVPAEVHEGEAKIATSAIAWGDPLFGSAHELLCADGGASDTDDRPISALEQAQRFLQDSLTSGSCLQTELEAAANSAGLAWATVRRAKDAPGIVSRKSGAGWSWSLPTNDRQDAQDAHQNRMSALSTLAACEPDSSTSWENEI